MLTSATRHSVTPAGGDLRPADAAVPDLTGSSAGTLVCSWIVNPDTGMLRSAWCGQAALDEQRLGDGVGFTPQPAFVHESSEFAESQAVA